MARHSWASACFREGYVLVGRRASSSRIYGVAIFGLIDLWIYTNIKLKGCSQSVASR